MHSFVSNSSPRRGSALIVAIIISAVIGISLVSYINLSLNSLKLADRTFYANAALNLTELGLEEALYRYNQMDSYSNPADAWSGWSISGNAAARKFPGFSPGPNVDGVVRVYCPKYNPTPKESPYVIAEATVSLPQGPPVKKLVRIKIHRRSIFGSGMTGRNSVSLFGSSSADSFQSDPDGSTVTPPVQYSAAGRRDEVLVASASSVNYAVDLSGAGVDVYGRVATGGGSIQASSWTQVQDEDSPSSPLIDPSLVTTDFSATFPDVWSPTPTVVNIVSSDVNATTIFPRGSDAVDPDGRYYYVFDSGSEISLPNMAGITITDDVTWILENHSGVTAVSFSNTNVLEIALTGSLELYTNGDINFANSCEVNPTMDAGRFVIYGTNPTVGGQDIIFNHANTANVAIYAPNADLQANASVSLSGAIVANSIELNNYAAFHFDESLGVLGGNPYHLSEWREIKAASDRDAYAGVLSF